MKSETRSSEHLLDCCLFFTANALARTISRIGEELFAPVGMTPSYAFLLMLACEQPGISQKELAALLHLTPSTISRFVDTLTRRGLLRKHEEGRSVLIHATQEGEALLPAVRDAWRRLYEQYSSVLGHAQGAKLTRMTSQACRKLEGLD